MTRFNSASHSSEAFGSESSQELDYMKGFDGGGDAVEAYFECISQCSLDDGECVTVCTTILREKS
ncbi:MAG: hypothetical protein VKN56_04045 [Cyanobacteriota bacterium]|nr:hypothetical protein [Cyanobacteriota bacterium]